MSLKVLMIAPTPFFGDRGCHIRILEEIRALSAKGVRVLLLTYPGGNEVPGIDTHRIIPGRSRIHDDRIGPHFGKFVLDGMMLFSAFRGATSFRPDVIHGHLHEGCLIGGIVGKSLKIPVVFDYQGSLSGELEHHGFIKPGSLAFAAFHRIEKVIDSLPGMVLVSSSAMLQAGVGVEWRYLPDALDTDEFSPMERDIELAEALGLPPEAPICVFLGLLNRYQGLDLLMATVARIKDKWGQKAHFLIMGYPNEEHYRSMAKNLGVDDCMTFTGRVPYDQAARYLNLGDFAVAPKIAGTESNGKIIDYMACGLATAALGTPVNRELMGDAGIYAPWKGIESNGAEALAEAVVKLSENKGLREELGARGRKRVLKHFSREALSQGLMAAYESVIGG